MGEPSEVNGSFFDKAAAVIWNPIGQKSMSKRNAWITMVALAILTVGMD